MNEEPNQFEQLAKEIFEKINEVRKDPKSFIEKIEKNKSFFKDKIFRHPLELPIETYEGKQALDDAIQFLDSQEPVDALELSVDLYKAAMDHARDLGSKGLSSHEGSDGSTLCDRIERYTEWDGAIAENLDFCYKYADNIVMNLIIDDGSEQKNQRSNLFNKDFHYVGVACHSHKTFKICTVVTFACGTHPSGTEPPDVINTVQEYIQRTKGASGEKQNRFQEDDPDAPDKTTSVKIVKLKKLINGIEKNITRKIYLLEDGKQHIVEIEDKE